MTLTTCAAFVLHGTCICATRPLCTCTTVRVAYVPHATTSKLDDHSTSMGLGVRLQSEHLQLGSLRLPSEPPPEPRLNRAPAARPAARFASGLFSSYERFKCRHDLIVLQLGFA